MEELIKNCKLLVDFCDEIIDENFNRLAELKRIKASLEAELEQNELERSNHEPSLDEAEHLCDLNR